MSIPDYQSLMGPLLAYAGDGSEKSIGGAIYALATKLGLSEEECSRLLPSGKQSIFDSRVRWAETYLEKAGAIARTRRSHFQITDRGRRLLIEHPDRIDNTVLRKFPEFLAFVSPKQEDKEDSQEVIPGVELPQGGTTPEESIQQSESQIFSKLTGDLLERILELPPEFFERVVVDLVVAMGYGGSRGSVAQRLGHTGDGGIDGVVNEDPLGLDVIYIQAKRYAPDNKVGRERVQQFAGALAGRGASKGVFVTTSAFTSQAIDCVKPLPQRIILIDGDRLTRLMVQYGIGVRTERSIDIKKIDADYFDDSED